MSTAVAEVKPVVVTPEPPPVPNPIFDFKMPKPGIGEPVVYWKRGELFGVPDVAYILRVGERNCVVKVAGIAYHSVPHITDPRLKLNADQRSSGAWDFPADKERIENRLKDVEKLAREALDRVAVLEDLVAEAPPKGKK